GEDQPRRGPAPGSRDEMDGRLAAECSAFFLRQRCRAAVGVDMDDDEQAADAHLAVTRDLERPGDRGLTEPLRPDAHLDLVFEDEHLQELGLDLAARIARPLLQQSELAPDPGLGHFRPAERRREVDTPTGVRVHPRDARALDVLDGHGRTRTRPGAPPRDTSIAALISSSGYDGPSCDARSRR